MKSTISLAAPAFAYGPKYFAPTIETTKFTIAVAKARNTAPSGEALLKHLSASQSSFQVLSSSALLLL